ncbi:purine/pyrimidine permease [Jeotgalibacillus proteolyticus]|uniref:Purine permease n=1 Tax=Jeotgalibacillus proteolyticus TaxID=2082395 RepID=A0A2S5GFY0_9BACL|nr:purine/pyrimidine permease [Jeotgalibacillus proteolyticus]PPA71940.1 purine permease [Jeotgalibacillus proteolyticus]
MKLVISSFQWFVFIIAASIAAPIAIAAVFQLDPAETAGFVQRTMLVLGAAGIVQVFIGHKLPINEGPAGLWWGVFAIYATFSGIIYSSPQESLQVLQSGLLLSGVFFVLLSLTGIINKITSLFTPAVTFTYLMLLIFQLSGSFLNGMVGLPNQEGTVQFWVMAGSLVTVCITFWLSGHKVKWVQRYSIVLAIGIGWAVFALVGEAAFNSSPNGHLFSLPEFFAFGGPLLDSGIVVTAFFITFLLTANMVASIRVMESALSEHFGEKPAARYRQAGYAAGINTIFSGAASAIGPVPIAGAAGYVVATKSPDRKPFWLGCLLVVLTSFIPFITNALAQLPAAVAFSVTFVIFTNMIRLAFMEWNKEKNIDRGLTVIGISLLVGVGLMFVPSSAYAGLPVWISSILSNGLISGTITAVIVEQWHIYYNRRNNKIADNS